MFVFLKKEMYLVLCLTLVVCSCTTPLKEVTYLNEIKTNRDYANGPVPDVYRIRANDQLYIRVISDNPEDVAFLNALSPQGASTMAGSGSSMELVTYLVGEDGNVDYPYLGKIKVQGLTVTEVKQQVQKEVDRYMKGAAVFVKQVNRTITVLGEVNGAGQQAMLKNKLTIFEALGTAGDITDWGNRQNIKVIRESDNSKFVAELDLTDPNIINSPYYYILPHDMIYVEHRTKVYGAKNLGYATPISITSAILSIGALVLNLFIN